MVGRSKFSRSVLAEAFLWIFGERRGQLEMHIDGNRYCVGSRSEHKLISYGCLSERKMVTIQFNTL
jgi:hypothetical protein